MATEELKGGKLLKVVYLDENKTPIGESSHQIPEDPFMEFQNRGLQEPPFPPESLMHLADLHPIHAGSIDQKVADVVGTGWVWEPREGLDKDPDEKQKTELEEWFNGLFPDGDPTALEALGAMWGDVETYSNAYFEIARDPSGIVRRIFTVPAHTIRVHKDDKRLAQVRGGKLAWFRRWGVTEEQVDRSYGYLKKDVEPTRRANDLLVIRRRSRRSTYYGTPTYISAIGWISLALAARDDNLLFFQNRREPRWAVVLTNIEETPDIADEIRRAFTVDLKEPHRNIVIPFTGPANVKFEKLSSDRAEGSYAGLSERADVAILVGHRMPPERLGMVRIGPLGGNVVMASSRIYKEAVINPSQALLGARMNAFIQKEWPGGNRGKAPDDKKRDEPLDWVWKPVEPDLGEEAEERERVIATWQADLITLDEAREKIGEQPIADATADASEDADESEEAVPEKPDERGNKLHIELKSPAAADPAQEAADGMNDVRSQLDSLLTGATAPEPPPEEELISE